ncbi:hypothetical protein KPL78_22335 [Roseomonas sp. HJA6]|uniref:DUF2946 domain-containing protein n=1 Tax=Roseomonas alba TaxID=2846776 RepID=A0ABS7AE85_9PROT|nr:DUF2946 family protein [Neoroseomonas alba]MBW6400614.1 hypothetical protein [Neoroseomonas alba]
MAYRPVARLIAAILLLQVVLAPLHCLAMAAAPAGFETVLCSPAGMERTILVGPDGQELPQQLAGDGLCVVCVGLAHAALPEPPAAPAPAWVKVGPAWFIAGADSRQPPARGPPYRPTGPPALS